MKGRHEVGSWGDGPEIGGTGSGLCPMAGYSIGVDGTSGPDASVGTRTSLTVITTTCRWVQN